MQIVDAFMRLGCQDGEGQHALFPKTCKGEEKTVFASDVKRLLERPAFCLATRNFFPFMNPDAGTRQRRSFHAPRKSGFVADVSTCALIA
jgi:hypothetical protein